MKKYLAAFLIIVIPTIFFFYIPIAKNPEYNVSVNCTLPAFLRQYVDHNKFQNWWPGVKIANNTYLYNGDSIQIKETRLNGIEMTVFNKADSIPGILRFSPYGTDSTLLKWSSQYYFSSNPIKRFKQYYQLEKTNDVIKSLINDIKKYFDVQQNVYGIKIEETKITTSSYMSTKQTFSEYPSSEKIYAMIQSLRNYIKTAEGKEKEYPIMHIEKEGPAEFFTMVSIPTTTVLASKGEFELKQMFLGKVLTAEVKGGVYTVQNGEEELARYVSDYHKMSPAISFQSLVTDRLSEPDTTKWVTRLYYPIF